MKKSILFFAAIVGFTVSSLAQGPRVSPKKESESDLAKVVYSSPAKKDRVIFGSLVPYNEVWRTGANEATELTIKSPVMLGGQRVEAGTYTLYTIPSETGEWDVILNPTLKQWGAYEYQKIKDKDLPHVKAVVAKTENISEDLSITINANNFTIAWDDVLVNLPITPAVSKKD